MPSLPTAVRAPTAFVSDGSCSSLKPSTSSAPIAHTAPLTGSEIATLWPPWCTSKPGGTTAADPSAGTAESTAVTVPVPMSCMVTVFAACRTSNSGEVAVTVASSVIDGTLTWPTTRWSRLVTHTPPSCSSRSDVGTPS